MPRTGSIVCVLMIILLAVTVAAQTGGDSATSGKAIKVRWFGQASFMLTTSQGTTILIDPINFKGYQMPEGTTADIVTVSHEHIDHNCVEAVSGTPVVFRGTNEKCTTVNAFDTTIGDVRLYSVPSYHSPGGERTNAIFVFEFDGIRIAHLGDIGRVLTNEQLEAIGEVDMLMIPVGGYYTVELAQADSIVSQIDASRFVVPMHYRTEAFDALPHTVEEFLEGKEKVRRIEGNSITLDLPLSEDTEEYLVMSY